MRIFAGFSAEEASKDAGVSRSGVFQWLQSRSYSNFYKLGQSYCIKLLLQKYSPWILLSLVILTMRIVARVGQVRCGLQSVSLRIVIRRIFRIRRRTDYFNVLRGAGL